MFYLYLPPEPAGIDIASKMESIVTVDPFFFFFFFLSVPRCWVETITVNDCGYCGHRWSALAVTTNNILQPLFFVKHFVNHPAPFLLNPVLVSKRLQNMLPLLFDP